MKYEGRLYGRMGKCGYIPLIMTSEDVDKIEAERDELQTALREMIAAKGRFNTQTAMERLIALLPENQTHES